MIEWLCEVDSRNLHGAKLGLEFSSLVSGFTFAKSTFRLELSVTSDYNLYSIVFS